MNTPVGVIQAPLTNDEVEQTTTHSIGSVCILHAIPYNAITAFNDH